jgi:hypothetical protein
MIMNRIFSFGLLVLTAAVGAAQAGVQAQFHLPFEARWGQAILAPGDYKVSLPESSTAGRQWLVTSQDKSVFVQPLVTDHDERWADDSKGSYLTLVKVNGMYVVSQYRSGPTGKVFGFPVPKPQHRVTMTDRDVLKLGASTN